MVNRSVQTRQPVGKKTIDAIRSIGLNGKQDFVIKLGKSSKSG
jgi:hypothetical protein